MNKALFALFLIFLTQISFAEETTEHRDGPCIKIMDACKSAGNNKSGSAEKKSLSKNCIQPLLNGEKVEGVTVNQNDLEACKAKKTEVKLKK